MSRVAIDVVILPDETMTDKAIEANRKLVKQARGKIVLNKENCLPHISLAMGCIERTDIGAIETLLKKIAARNPLLPLRALGIRTSTDAVHEKVSAFEVERTNEIQSLHEEVTDRLAPYFSSDVSSDMLYNPAEITDSTLLWIRNYRQESSFENFFPHITIGYGQMPDLPVPIQFTPCRLALCRLGNHCTCRVVLASVKLGAAD
ncbi:MAG: hypothetical protein ACYTBJ_04240 [Planctomycetota bacterium]|jgi:2'-5' RNA ligase